MLLKPNKANVEKLAKFMYRKFLAIHADSRPFDGLVAPPKWSKLSERQKTFLRYVAESVLMEYRCEKKLTSHKAWSW